MDVLNRIRIANGFVVACGVIGGGWFERYAGGASGEFSFDTFAVWVAAPSFVMLIPVVLANTVKAQVVVLVLSSLFVVGGLLLYWDAMFLHVDAQGALVFIFIPLYQFVAVVAVLCGVIFFRARAHMATNSTFERNARESDARPSM